MTSDQIRAALEEQGVTMNQLAAALEVAASSVSRQINTGTGSRRIGEAIAKLLGRPLEEIFPRYANPRHARGAARQQRVESLRERLRAAS